MMQRNLAVAIILPVILHATDRQRYYEALRGDHLGLTSLYLEAVQTTAETEMRVYDEAQKGPTKRRSKKSSQSST